uniref:Sugar phosphate transporter domain-containing protein n=1 Tax=Phaeomonas parva TaxID=124430 RepID=A0A7S1UAJ8_9STRA|mmetsp:Transcript_3923/g.11365  ORF Transcript_3923/g.11365 Transcript_3923/m.11365 type:complete len:432 (+) Transcript_3923:178-1473(+)
MGIRGTLFAGSSTTVTATTLALTAYWYGASILAICSSKAILDDMPAVGFLCFYQSTVSAVIAYTVVRSLGLASAHSSQLGHLFAAGLTYSGNLAFTNLSFLRGSAPLTETIKSTEPVIVGLLAIPTLGERLTIVGFLAVLLISLGTAIACVSDSMVMTYGGVVFASLAVVCQGSSSIAVKLLNNVLLPGEPAAQEASADVESTGTKPPHIGKIGASTSAGSSEEEGKVHHRVKEAGSAGVLREAPPSTKFVLEPKLVEPAPAPEAVGEARPLHPAVLFLNVSLFSMATSALFALATRETAAGDFVATLWHLVSVARSPMGMTEMEVKAVVLLAMLTANAFCYASYNIAAYIMLEKITATNYSVLNSLRRVIVILASTFLFNLDFSLTSLLGVGVAFSGFACHAYRGHGSSVSECFLSVNKRYASKPQGRLS